MDCLPDRLSGSPDLQIPDILHLLLVFLSVVWLRVVFQRPLRLRTGLYAVVKLVKNGLQGVLEFSTPVDSTPSGCRRACCVHPVHTVRTNQRVQALSCLLDGLIESFAGAVASLAEDFVLSKEHAVNATHQASSLAVQIRVDFFLECRLVEVSTANSNTERYSLLFGFAGHVLVDRHRGVDATALPEQGSHSTARSLGCDEDDIDIRGNIDLGKVFENRGEPVGEVKGLRDN